MARRLIVWAPVVVACVAAALSMWLWQQNRPVRQLRDAVAGQRWSDGLRLALGYLARHPNDAEVLRLTARCLSGLGQFAQAEKYFSQCNAGELPLEDLRLRSEALIALGRSTEAVQVLRTLQECGGEEPAVLQRLAILQFQRGQHEEAFQLAQEFGQKYPEHTAAAWCIQATFYVSLRRAAEAIECLEKAMTLDPSCQRMGLDPGTIKLFLGAALLDIGQSERARDWLRRAVEHTKTAEIYWHLGEAEMGCGDLRAAEQAWRKALEIDRQFHNALLSMGKLSLQEGRPLEALEWLTIAERLGKDSSALQNALSRANARLGRTDLATEHARKADMLRERERAKQEEQHLLARYPQHFQSRLLLTRKAIERGNVAEAKAMVEELLRQYPDNRDLEELRDSLVAP